MRADFSYRYIEDVAVMKGNLYGSPYNTCSQIISLQRGYPYTVTHIAVTSLTRTCITGLYCTVRVRSKLHETGHYTYSDEHVALRSYRKVRMRRPSTLVADERVLETPALTV